jgi:anaerobic dimethyl sulfoxide reductase subunit A
VGSLSEGEAGGEGAAIPVLRWPDAILGDYAPLKSPIKAVYTAGGNFLNQGADIRKNIRAFESLDFAVCHELFLTPTAAYCDVVLPAASPLQKEDIGIPGEETTSLQAPGPSPEGNNARHYDIFAELPRSWARGCVYRGTLRVPVDPPFYRGIGDPGCGRL